MSTTYSTTAGDTFESISRRFYGEESGATRIATANPGATDPLAGDLIIKIPDNPDAVNDESPLDPSQDPDEVVVGLSGVRFRHWSSFTLTRAIDRISTVALSVPFRPESPLFRAQFRPLNYQPLQVSVGGRRIINGTVVNIDPSIDASSNIMSVGGYGRAGVLNDCTPSSESFPISWDDAHLHTIAEQLTRPFGILPVFKVDDGPAFSVSCAAGRTVLSFLNELARQNGIAVADDVDGNLLFQKSPQAPRELPPLGEGFAIESQPNTKVLHENRSPLTEVTSSFNAQQYYSDIVGLGQSAWGLKGEAFPIKNYLLDNVFRPFNFEVNNHTEGDVLDVVKAKAARMFGNMISFSVKVSTWRNPDGELWAPNQSIRLHAPSAMIYKPYTFLIRSVSLTADSTSRTAALELVIPGLFSDSVPEGLPWD